jgi:hypothetical protein
MLLSVCIFVSCGWNWSLFCIFITSSTSPNIFLCKTFHILLWKVTSYLVVPWEKSWYAKCNTEPVWDKRGDDRRNIIGIQIPYSVSFCCRLYSVCHIRVSVKDIGLSSIPFAAFVTLRLSLSTAMLYNCMTMPTKNCNEMICIQQFHNF